MRRSAYHPLNRLNMRNALNQTPLGGVRGK